MPRASLILEIKHFTPQIGRRRISTVTRIVLYSCFDALFTPPQQRRNMFPENALSFKPQGRQKRKVPTAEERALSRTLHPGLVSDATSCAFNPSRGDANSSGFRESQSSRIAASAQVQHVLPAARGGVAVRGPSPRSKRHRATGGEDSVKLAMPMLLLDDGNDDAAAVQISIVPTEKSAFSETSKM